MTREQQVALAQTMAGTRQYNNLLALFNNWDMYTDALETSAHAAGTLQKQQDIYMESTEAHLQKMRTEAEETYKTLFDVDTVNSFIDVFTGLNSLLNAFLKGLGGGMNDFAYFGALITQIFNKQIAGGIDNFINKLEILKNNKSTIAMLQSINEEGFSDAFGANKSYVTDAVSEQFERNAELLKLQPSMKEEEFNKMNLLSQEITYYEEIARLKEQALNADTSESEILKAQIADLEAQNEELRERLQLTKAGQISKQDIEKWVQTDGIFNSKEKGTLKGILKESEGRALTEEQTKQILDMEERAQIRIGEVLKTKYNTQKNINESAEVTIEQARTEAEVRKQIYKEMKEQQERQQKIGQNIAGFSSLVQFGTTLSGLTKTIREAADGTLEWSDALGQIAAVSPALLASGAQAISWLSQIPPHILVITAAVTAAVATIAFAVNEISLFIDKDRVLREELEANKKAVEESTKKYDELKTTLSNYSSAKEGIKNLKEGTLEFYEAIVKTNEEAKKLIEALQLQAGSQYQIDSNGLITINEDALKQGMFNQAQDLYQKQLTESITQFAINERQRNKEITELTKQFQKNVSEKTPGGYGISYEQAQQMIEAFVLKEEETEIDIGELTKNFATNEDQNFANLCTLITEEMSDVKAKISEKNAERREDAILLGAQSIKAYGQQEQVEAMDQLPTMLRESINESIGQEIAGNISQRVEAGTTGRNVTNTFEQMAGLAGQKIQKNPLA